MLQELQYDVVAPIFFTIFTNKLHLIFYLFVKRKKIMF